MSVKRYYWDRKSDCDCEIIEQPDGAMVDYDEHASVVAALEAQLAALTAENAGLKAAAEFATASDMWEELGGNVMRYQYQEWYADKLKSAMKTPATDAFLAEVRAQGVDMFAAHKRERQQALRSRSMRMSEESAGMAADAEDFAAQLRKGVQS